MGGQRTSANTRHQAVATVALATVQDPPSAVSGRRKPGRMNTISLSAHDRQEDRQAKSRRRPERLVLAAEMAQQGEVFRTCHVRHANITAFHC
jgi:hypothetical protein